jgi:ATP-dependent helicase/nuclease subunit B
VVVDYKSSLKRLDPVMMQHGLQLQLPAYLNVLRHWTNPRPVFGVGRLIPAGVFYVNLRGNFARSSDRDEIISGADTERRRAYRHIGRFDTRFLPRLDQRPDASEGDQFNYRRNKDGSIRGGSSEAMDSESFHAMLDTIESSLKRMGQSVYAGVTTVDPYRKGTKTACDTCDYHSICRIDPWTHAYRNLKKAGADVQEEG